MPSGFARVLAGASCAFFIFLVVGCSGPTGKKLFGKATAGGKSIGQGAVIVMNESGGEIFTGQIISGEYEVLNVPSGRLKIAVTVSDGRPRLVPPPPGADRETREAFKKAMASRRGANRESSTPSVIIPSEYQDIEKTPLTYDTAYGEKFDIEIP